MSSSNSVEITQNFSCLSVSFESAQYMVGCNVKCKVRQLVFASLKGWFSELQAAPQPQQTLEHYTVRSICSIAQTKIQFSGPSLKIPYDFCAKDEGNLVVDRLVSVILGKLCREVFFFP